MPRSPSPTFSTGSLAPRLRRCLVERGPLTPRIERECGGPVRVEVLHQGWGRPTARERRRLGLPAGARALLREVRLLSAGEPRVHARSVIPVVFLRAEARQLTALGTRPLGDRLFALRGIRRVSLETFSLGGRDPSFERIARRAAAPGERLWGRRSVFEFRGRRMSIVEIFLPELLR